MIKKVYSSAHQGIRGIPVVVEVDCVAGLPGFSMVGLPDGAVRESRERMVSALRGCGFQALGKRITVNLAPASIRKEGASFDLAMAIGLLLASEQIDWPNSDQWMLIGELSLDGKVRSVRGALSSAFAARQAGIGIVVPWENYHEARLVSDLKVIPVQSLESCVHWIRTGIEPNDVSQVIQSSAVNHVAPDFSSVHGLSSVRRALEIAASGNHHFLMVGSPGSGKTFCAQCMPTILPDLNEQEKLELVMIRSCAGLLTENESSSALRPFRSPHHSSSVAALIGGGRTLRPGEVSLAHHGLLFMDELPEFARNSLECLRQPLEQGFVSLARATDTVEWPSRFLLGAAMNPCPCGYHGDPSRPCQCSPQEVSRYRNRISGPLLDRMDLQIPMPRQGIEAFSGNGGESSQWIRNRVLEARARQYHRTQKQGKIKTNGHLGAEETRRFCKIQGKAEAFLSQAVAKMGLSTRGIYRIVRVARTIADLRGAEIIELSDLAEAIQYRNG